MPKKCTRWVENESPGVSFQWVSGGLPAYRGNYALCCYHRGALPEQRNSDRKKLCGYLKLLPPSFSDILELLLKFLIILLDLFSSLLSSQATGGHSGIGASLWMVGFCIWCLIFSRCEAADPTHKRWDSLSGWLQRIPGRASKGVLLKVEMLWKILYQ